MLQCKAVSVPLMSCAKQQVYQVADEVDVSKYRRLIGKLMYVTHSRPDIAFSVSLLSRFMHKPNKIHQGAAKHVLRYLAGTQNYGILYHKECEDILQGFSDSDWGTNSEDRKSTTGVVFNFGSGVITWMSKKHEIVALSSTEAEYIALCAAGCQGIWLKQVLVDCGIKHEKPITIKCDNKACIAIAKNPVHHGRTKHIDIKYHFIRDLVSKDVVRLEYCASADQLADIMTKSVDLQKFVKFRKQMGVCTLQSRGSLLDL